MTCRYVVMLTGGGVGVASGSAFRVASGGPQGWHAAGALHRMEGTHVDLTCRHVDMLTGGGFRVASGRSSRVASVFLQGWLERWLAARGLHWMGGDHVDMST